MNAYLSCTTTCLETSRFSLFFLEKRSKDPLGPELRLLYRIWSSHTARLTTGIFRGVRQRYTPYGNVAEQSETDEDATMNTCDPKLISSWLRSCQNQTNPSIPQGRQISTGLVCNKQNIDLSISFCMSHKGHKIRVVVSQSLYGMRHALYIHISSRYRGGGLDAHLSYTITCSGQLMEQSVFYSFQPCMVQIQFEPGGMEGLVD